MRPRVLLLDEPLSALDKKLREQMQTELRQLQRHVGITFVLVTHDQEEALTMSDRCAVMFDGRIAQLASPEELYRRPVSRRVASFIGVMNFFEARVAGRERRDDRASTSPASARSRSRATRRRAASTAPPARVGIRPEMLTILLEDGDSAEHEVTGEVTDTSYYGDMTYYTIRLPGAEAPATVSMRNTAGRRILRQGETARVGWGRELVLLLS